MSLPLRCVLLVALLGPASALPGFAALPNPDKQDIDYITEHVPESAMDARFLALPWPSGRLEVGTWQTTVEAGWAATEASFLKIDGPLLAASAAYSFRDGWAVQGIGFYDAMTVSGGNGREVLHPTFVRPPLDLPENADFSHPRGDYRYLGAGAGLVWQRPGTREDRWWTYTAGVLWTHLELKGFQVDYEVASGASAGVRGVLDHSGTNDFATPYVGAQWTRPLGRRFAIAPRAIVVWALPPGGFAGRLTGPGFDLDAPDGGGLKIGDGFAGFGLELLDRPTGLGIDLGGTLYFAGAEGIIHEGVRRAICLQMTWHR